MTASGLNLLPWRERREKRRKVNYWFFLALSTLAPFLLALALNLQARSELGGLRDEIRQASLEREAMTGIVEERQLLEVEIGTSEGWLRESARLAQRRSLVLDLWSELSRHLPDAVYYERIAADREGILISGITASSPELASYLRRLEASPSFSAPRLIDLEDHPSGHRFSIEASVWMQDERQ